jgi:hypothetical protein
MELEKLKIKLEKIKEKGWIESKRRGNTGIGYTLESLLDIKENNLKLPDFGDIELKSQRKNVSNRVTMFTFNRAVWKIRQKDLIEKYGYIDTNKRKALYCTSNTKPNNQGLFLEVTENNLILNHVDGTLIAEWKINNLIKAFKEKMPALIAVFADTRINSEEKEEFYFNEAYFLKNPDIDNFIDLLKKDIIIVDIRMHLKKNNAVRNHGTAFRIDEKFLYLSFSKKVKLV